jgi:iron complex outermembrane recepter protein
MNRNASSPSTLPGHVVRVPGSRLVPSFSLYAALLASSSTLAAVEPTDTVVVTATRTQQSSFDVPAAIDAVDGNDLREHKLRVNLSEGLGRVPGLHAQNRFNYAQDLQVSSRGFGARASFGVRGVRLIQDGIPLTMPDGQGQTGSFDLDGAQRVEVLRGPFAALYGNSSGGVIHLIGAAPTDKSANIELSTTVAENELWRAASRMSGHAGPVELTGNLSRFMTDGVRDHSAARRDVANVRVRYARSDNASLTLIANALDQPDTQDPLGLTQAELDTDSEQAGTNALAFNTRKSTRHLQGGLAYEQTLSDRNRLRAMAYFGDRDVTQYLANPSTALTGSGGVVDLARRFGGSGLQWDHGGSLAGAPYELTVGAEYDRMEEHRRGFVNVNGTRGELRRDEDDTVYGLNQYVIASWQPAQRWKLSAGVRHSDVRFDVDDHFIVGPNPDDSGRLRYDSTQPVAGVLFEVTPSINVFASGGRAFETPTFAELAYRPDGAPGLNFDLDAATSTNFETGAKFRLREHTRFTATLFHSDTKQDIVTGPSPFQGRNSFVNADKTRRQGAELAAESTIDHFDLYVAYTYTRARFENFTSFSGVDLSGNRLPGVPEQSAYAELIWTHPASGFATGLEARWVDRIFVDDANSATASDYVTLNWHVGWRQRVAHWDLNAFVRVDNVADEDYVGSVIVNAANARFFEPAPGRVFFLGVTAMYGR